MKARHAPPKTGKNPHNTAGRPEHVCPKCETKVPPKAGFRFSSIKCPKCGASLGK